MEEEARTIPEIADNVDSMEMKEEKIARIIARIKAEEKTVNLWIRSIKCSRYQRKRCQYEIRR